jgi:hypothetical protein
MKSFVFLILPVIPNRMKSMEVVDLTDSSLVRIKHNFVAD